MSSTLTTHAAVRHRSLHTAVGRWLLRWLRLGLARDALFFLALVAALLSLLAAAWDRIVIDPRVESVIVPAAAHLGGVASAAAALAPAERDAFLKEIVQRSDGALALDDPKRWGLSEPASAIRARGLQILRELLPGHVIAFSTKGGNMFWLSLPADAPGGATWLRMRGASDDRGRTGLLVAVVAGVVLFVLAGAFVLSLQTRKRVQGWAASSVPAAESGPDGAHEEGMDHLRALHALDAQASQAARESLAQLERLCKALSTGAAHPPGASVASVQALPQVRHGSALRGRLRVDFLADVATMLVLLGLVLGGLGWTFDRLISRPRFEAGADFVAIQIRGIRNAMAALAPERRQAFLDDISRSTRGRMEADDPARWPLGPAELRSAAFFASLMRERLAGMTVQTTPAPHRLLWFSLGPGSGAGTRAGDEVSLRLRAPDAVNYLTLFVRSIFAVVVMIAVFVVWRGRRRADRLLSSLARLRDEGQGPASSKSSSLDEDLEEAEQALAADPRLRQSVEQSIRRREKDDFNRAQLAQQAHATVAQLRLLRPPGAAGVAFEGLLDALDQWVRRVEPHGGAAGAGEAEVIDINDVLARVSHYADVPVRLEQGGVPYVNLGSTSALRLFRALLEGLEPDYAVGVDMVSLLDHGWVVVQVRDPVGSASQAQMMAREGIEVARNLASAHGGVIRLSPMPEGGWLAEVWFPCARLPETQS